MSLITANNISVISEDPIFINQIKIFSQKSSFNFKFIRNQWTESPTDLFIIDFNLLGNFLGGMTSLSKIKFIVRGKQKDLKPSFNAGCIDYLKTPCDMEELEIRLSNVFNLKSDSLKWQNITLKQDSITTKGFSVNISVEEHYILKMLIQNLGEPVPREALYFVLPGNHKKDSRVVDMHISNLRKKIRKLQLKSKTDCGNIKTVRSYGYMTQ